VHFPISEKEVCLKMKLNPYLISPTFYTHIFRTKVFHAAFLQLHFGFVIFWQKDIVEIDPYSKFHQRYMCKFVIQMSFWQFFSSYMYVVKAAKNDICTKKARVKCWWNWPLYSISPTFYDQLFCKKSQSSSAIREKLCKTLSQKKSASKMFMK